MADAAWPGEAHPLRVLTVWSPEEAERLATLLIEPRRRNVVDLVNEAAYRLSGAVLPGHYDVLIVPSDVFARLRASVRRSCLAGIRLLVLTPGINAEQPDLSPQPMPAVLRLDALPPAVVVPVVGHMLAALAKGDTPTAAARHAHQSAMLDETPPALQPGDQGDQPLRAPREAAPRTSLSEPQMAPAVPSSGANVFNREAYIDTFVMGSVVNQTHDGPAPDARRPRSQHAQAQIDRLFNFMTDRCSWEDLRTVWFRLGYRSDEYSPKHKSELAGYMIEQMERRGRLIDLATQLAAVVPERRGELADDALRGSDE